MPRGKFATEIQPRIQFSMDPELYRRVSMYHKSVNPNRLASETIREILYLGSSALDNSALMAALRVIGAKRATAMAYTEIYTFLNDLALRIQRLAEAESANIEAEARFAAEDAIARNRGSGL
jgi:hypothetical protein